MDQHATGSTRPRRAVVAGAGLLVLVGLAGATGPPRLGGDRDAEAARALRAQVQQVARAQDAWMRAHGTYTTQLGDLGLGEGPGEVAIVRADARSWCAGAYDGRTRTSLFYAVPGGLSATACPGAGPDG